MTVDPAVLILVGGLVVCLVLSRKQFEALISKYGKSFSRLSSPAKPAAVLAKSGTHYGKKEPMQKVTPLMITPEQVKNYDDRPWRPFRWPYHQTMSIFKLDINHWLDMDKYYWHYIQEKERIWHTYGKENIDWLPEGYDASEELMQTVTDHLVERYPLLFTVLEDKKDRGKIVKNELTKEILDMTYPLKEHPLLYVTKLAKEDFYLVKKNPEDGLHYLVAAAVPFPGGSFGIDHKIGRNLDVIHAEVPYYHEKLKTSMERWFERLEPENPVERASWYITWDHKLKVNNIYQIPKFVPDLEAEMNNTDAKEFNVRVERQTLRRLPKSNAIIFTNHPIFYSLEEMKDEPLVPSLLKKIIYEAPEKIIKYKNFAFIRDHISGYLDTLIKRQIDKKLIDEDTPVKTLPTYPFAYWAKTDFDLVNGWLNPTTDKNKFNYSQTVHSEKQFGNE